jgi:hypothetical protein
MKSMECLMPRVDDLSRSLLALNQGRTLVAVISAAFRNLDRDAREDLTRRYKAAVRSLRHGADPQQS